MAHELVFTALPSTGPERKPRISVLVTIRLDPGAADATLGDLGGFLWPELAARLELAIAVGGPTPIAATWSREALAPRMWHELFPPETPVKAWQVAAQVADYKARPIRTYSVRQALAQIDGVYRTLATDGGARFPGRDHPAVQRLNQVREGLFGYMRNIGNEHVDPHSDQGRRMIKQRITELPDDETRAWADTLMRVTTMYDAPVGIGPVAGNRQYEDSPLPKLKPPRPPRPHFHERVTMVSHYPALMRPLGLVLDLEFDAGKLPAAGVMSIEVHGTPPDCAVRSLRTRFTQAGHQLQAADGGDVRAGMVRLGPDGHHVAYQNDVDGTLLKLAIRASEAGYSPEERAVAEVRARYGDDAHGVALAARVEQSARHTPESLPSVRTGAITVARDDRAGVVTASFDRAAALATTPEAELTIDDLYQGYRVDVEMDGSGTWLSLCQRTETGHAGGQEWPKRVDPEGIVSVPGGTTGDPDPTTGERPLRVHEALFSWDGWSLVAQRPGRVIDDIPHRPSDEGPLAIRVDARATAGTLPRLRYGRAYRMRARVVDLAGNSLPLDAHEGPDHVTPPITYLRHEPVPTPPIGPLTYFTEGESLEHLVIRSAGGIAAPSAAAYAAAADPDLLYAASNQRHVVPPKVTQTVAEAHGMIDGLDRDTSFAVSAREMGAPGDTWVIEPDSTYRKLPEEAVMILGPGRLKRPARALADGNGAGTFKLDPAAFGELLVDIVDGKRQPWRGTPLEQGEHLAWPETMEVSWLPDPMALGVRLWDRERSIDQRFEVDGAWPRLRAQRLVLEQAADGVGEVALAATGRDLVVGLARGRMLTLRLSSLLERKRLPHHAWWAAAGAGSAGRKDIEASQHWMVTPWRELTFVHAVQRPLQEPDAPERDRWQRVAHGDTFAVIAGVVTLDAPSTGHVDLEASWRDKIDNMADAAADPENDVSEHGGHVAQVAVGYASGLELPDAASGDATTIIRHDLGDTRYHKIDYRLVATTRYREYFAPSITADPANLTLAGPTLTTDIRSSAVPEPPKVLYVMPTFRWTAADADHKHRTGRGLRVWLDRPWWSSGDGELLGVVVASGRDDRAPELLPVVTQWGADPRFEDSAPGGMPTALSFPNALQVTGPIAIPGAGGARARVAGYRPRFDRDRKLWYADLDVDSGAAVTPFVSLALCRWQPMSLPGVELSTVVRADFVQVLADRGAAVAWGDHKASVIVTLDHPPLPRTWRDPHDVLLHVELVREPVVHATLPRRIVDAVMPHGFELRPRGPDVLLPQPAQWLGWPETAHHTEAELQWRPGADVDRDLDWRRVTGTEVVVLHGRINKVSSERQWYGELGWGALDATRQYRVLIRQYELLAPDPDVRDKPVVLPFDRRIMFAAEFVLARGA